VTDPSLRCGEDENAIPAEQDEEDRFCVSERKFEGEGGHQLRDVTFHAHIHSFVPR